MNGWVCLHRSLLGHPRFTDAEWVSVWVFLLLNATHQNLNRIFGGKLVTLKPGELITSRKSISRATGINESKIERVLACMKTEHQIEQRTDRQCRIISLANWQKYQTATEQSEQRNGQRSNNERTTSEHTQQHNNKTKRAKRLDTQGPGRRLIAGKWEEVQS